MNQVIDNPERGRFELHEEGKLAYAEYHRHDGVLGLPYVWADPSLRGRGAAARLMEGVLALVRERGLKVDPICGYAVAYLRRHPEHHNLLA